MGLLDFTPDQAESLLNFGKGLLAAGGPSRTPVSFGQAFANGIDSMQAGDQFALRQKALKQQMEQEQYQTEQMRLAAERQKRVQALAAKYGNQAISALSNGQGPTVENAAAMTSGAPSFDYKGYANELAQYDPMASLQLQTALQQKAPKMETVKPGETLGYVDTAGKWNQVFNAPSDDPLNPNKPFMLKDGQIVPNKAYQDYELARASAGAARTKVEVPVSVNTAKAFGSEFGGIAAKTVSDAIESANGAAATLENVSRIKKAVADGALAGPMAGTYQTILQIGQNLGATGKDTAEKLKNTAVLMQGMAKEELNAAAMMKGQGQITESERSILRNASIGDITKFTGPQIVELTNALEKVAKAKISRAQQLHGKMRADPNLQPISDYFSVPSAGPAESAMNGGGWSASVVPSESR